MPAVKTAAAIVTLAAAAVSGFAQATQAADLPVKAPPPPPAAVAALSWTGFYVGGHAGYGWGEDGGMSFTDFFPGAFATSFGLGQTPRFVGVDPQGAIGGGKIGYNLQVTPQWVLGLQADLSASSIKGSGTYNFAGIPGGVPAPATTHVAQSLDWLSTIRGRVGYAFDRLLVFGTGGLAFGAVKSDFEINYGAGLATVANSVSSTRSGWSAGAGAEYKLDARWSASVEWLHYDLGQVNVQAPEVLFGVPQTFGLIGTTVTKGDVVSAALNYKL
jgi:outer membrane immunogenic protein